MSDNVVGFGRVVQADTPLSEEDKARVDAVRLEFQDHLFDNFEAPNMEHENPNRGKRLSQLPHLYSMMLSDRVILEALDNPELEEVPDLHRVLFYQLSMMNEFNELTNAVFGTGWKDLNEPEE